MNRRRGFTIWFTGLSGSGKTTLAHLVSEELQKRGMPVEILDGDTIRTHLSKGLGFSKEDRDINIRRIGWVCQLLTRHGVPNITAAVSPYRDVRQEVRRSVEAVGGPNSFIEVFVNCPLAICEKRDPKGLYKKARQGEIPNFTGISDPYEPPDKPELTVDTGFTTPEESTASIIAFLFSHGWVQEAR